MKTNPRKKGKKVSGPVPKKDLVKAGTFRFTHTHFYTAFVVACFAFALYANSIKSGYVLDDYSAITINRYVQEGFAGIPELMKVDFWHFSNLKLGYYRPLSLVTFAVEYQFFGPAPHVSHFFNVVFFALTLFFLYLLLARLFSAKNLVFPLLICLLFAAHPIHTEVIDNIKGRDELLSFFNTVLMLFFSVRYADRKRIRDLVSGLIFFYFALLSKESAMTGIFLLPLVLYYAGQQKLSGLALKVFPFLLIIFVFFIQRRIALGPVQAVIPDDIINYPYRDPAVKFSTAFFLFLFGIKMLIWPCPLRYDYSFNQIPAVGWDNAWAFGGLAIFFGLLVYGIIQIKKKTPTGLGLGFFYIALVPMMAFIFLRGGIFTERNLFAPSLGFCIMIIALLEMVFSKAFQKDQTISYHWIVANPVIILLILAMVIACSVIVIQRNPVWVDSLTLFANDIKTGENSAQNQLHYGSDLVMKAANEKDPKVKDQLINAGMSAIRKSLSIHPTFGDAMFRYAYSYEVKLNYRLETRYVDSALWFFKKAIEFSPTLSDAYRHLGIIYEWLQQYDLASYYFNKAYEINPQLLEAKKKADEIKATRGLDVKVDPLPQGQERPLQIRFN